MFQNYNLTLLKFNIFLAVWEILWMTRTAIATFIGSSKQIVLQNSDRSRHFSEIEKVTVTWLFLTFSMFLSVPSWFSLHLECPSMQRCSWTMPGRREQTRLSDLINWLRPFWLVIVKLSLRGKQSMWILWEGSDFYEEGSVSVHSW